MTELSKTQQQLAVILDKIFADGVLDDSEREELRDLFANRGLKVSEVTVVVEAFVAKMWGETIEDGLITDEEKARLETVIKELKLPTSALPEEIRRVFRL